MRILHVGRILGNAQTVRPQAEALFGINAADIRISELKKRHWQIQRDVGLDYVTTGDFSLYDRMLDVTCMLGAVPGRTRISYHTYCRQNRIYGGVKTYGKIQLHSGSGTCRKNDEGTEFFLFFQLKRIL